MSLLQAADFAFMGKSLPPHHGGQNPIEPVALSLPLVMGPNHQNFRETCSELVTQKALLIEKMLLKLIHYYLNLPITLNLDPQCRIAVERG